MDYLIYLLIGNESTSLVFRGEVIQTSNYGFGIDESPRDNTFVHPTMISFAGIKKFYVMAGKSVRFRNELARYFYVDL